MPPTTRKAATKRAPAKRTTAAKRTTTRGRAAGVPNRATVRRKELEQFMGKTLTRDEVAFVKANPGISNEDFVRYVQEQAGMVGGTIVGDEELTPAEIAGGMGTQYPPDWDEDVLEKADAVVQAVDAMAETVASMDGREQVLTTFTPHEDGSIGTVTVPVSPLVVIDEEAGQQSVACEGAYVISLVAIRRSQDAYVSSQAAISNLLQLSRTPLVTKTLRDLHAIAGEALGV